MPHPAMQVAGLLMPEANSTTSESMTPFGPSMMGTADWDAALQTCNQVLCLDPHHLGALEVKAQALWFTGRYADLVTTTTQLLLINPLEPAYRMTRGMARIALGQLAAAQQDLAFAIQQSNSEGFRRQAQEALASLEAFRNGSPVADGPRLN
jgi:regulator of sirC expression with transglutaminase-like and TPR domain